LELWLHCRKFKAEIPDVVAAVAESYDRNKPDFVAIETGGNPAVYQACRRKAMVVKPLSPAGTDKLARATPAINLVADRRVYLPDCADWTEEVETELSMFTGTDGHDDVVDTLSYAAKIMLGDQDMMGGDQSGEILTVRSGFWASELSQGIASAMRDVPLLWTSGGQQRGRPFGGLY
jgi:predicted phage terminase large subunit-like protein